MRLRVLHVLESLSAGGMETTFLHVLRACRHFEPAIDHHVLAFAGGSLLPGYQDVTTGVTLAADTRRIDACLSAPYDLIHILFERCAYRLLPRIVAHSDVPIVYGKGYDMGGMYRLNEGLRWQADESMLAASDAVTFTTPQLASGYALPPGRQTVLRKAADIASFERIDPPAEATPLRIISVANLHPRKRLGDLITAFADVHRRVPGAELRLVGGGDPREAKRLEQLASTLAVDAQVTFVGPVSDVASELRESRVLALPSSCEGVPTVVLEAMAAARPVVVSRAGHVETIVDEGVEGFVVNVGDVTALTERLTTLLTDPVRAAAMGMAGRRRASRHNVASVAGDLLDAWVGAVGPQRLEASRELPTMAHATN